MGTMLFSSGLQFGDPPEMWNVALPQGSIVRRIHRVYLEAGARIILTNTFGGNRLRLSLHGNERHVDELNQMAAVLAHAEIDASGVDALVAGDIGPTGSIMFPIGPLEFEEAVDVFAEQAQALVAGGVDLIWIETMSDLEEIHAAITGVRRVASGIPIIATMTFDTRGHTMMGVSPERAVRALVDWGADAIGGNCGNGPDEIIPVIAQDARRGARRPPRRQVECGDAGARRHAGRLQGRPRRDGGLRARRPRGRRHDHRRLLRLHAGAPRRDGGGTSRG